MSARLELALAELAAAIREEVRTEAEAGPRAPDRLLSIAEAAAVLGIGRSALYGLIGAGEIRSLAIGRRRMIPSTAVTAYIAERAA